MPTFEEAVTAGDLASVQSKLVAQPSLASSRAASGVSMLLLAVYHGHGEVVAALQSSGVDLDVFDAAGVGATNTLEILLGLDPLLAEQTSADGFTALHLAAFFGHAAAVDVLLRWGASPSAIAANDSRVQPLHSAAAGGHVDIVRALLEAGADTDARQHGGFTALHAAAQDGDAAMAGVLMAHGADASVTTDDGRTPAALAAEHGHGELATALTPA
jgi:uncharacterized protein